jgi:hypothetical protein
MGSRLARLPKSPVTPNPGSRRPRAVGSLAATRQPEPRETRAKGPLDRANDVLEEVAET